VGTRGTVVRRQTRLRWAAVAVAVVVLGALPIVIGRWPVRAAEVDPHRLRERISASTGQPFQGYAQSSGSLGLPPIPRLTEVTALLSGTTQLRAWYAGRDRWRVDVVAPGSERGLYRQPGAEYSWDYGDNLLTRVDGSLPVRLPRAADLLPPDLARRFLSAAAADPVTALPDRRVAGVAAAGLRIVPADPHTSVRSVDVWAAPHTGLPLQVEITARGSSRPVLVSRFLEIDERPPSPDVLTPPAVRADMGYTETSTPDVVSAANRLGTGPLPDRLAGQPRRDAVAGVSAAAVYGAGLARFVVLAVPGSVGRQAYREAKRYGRRVAYPSGDAALLTTPLLSVLAIGCGPAHTTYLVAGFVDENLLRQAGAELAEFRP
jgi:hypothetical protein